MGAAHFQHADYDCAIYYLNNAINIRKEKEEGYEIVRSYLFLADALMEKKKFSEPFGYLQDALDENRDTKANEDQLIDIYERIGRYFQKTGKNDSAFHYSVLRAELLEKMLRQKIETSADALIASYEFDKKEKEIALLNSLKNQQDIEIRQQRLYLSLAFVGIILLAGFLYIFISGRNKKIEKLKLEAKIQGRAIEDSSHSKRASGKNPNITRPA